MELKQVVVNNGGMSQDLSVSKQENKLAFENRNIRIQATDDGTLLSVTNIKSPKTLKINLRNLFSTVLLGSCVTPEYLVLFTKGSRNPYAHVPSQGESWEGWTDMIFRISLDSIETDTPDIRELYNGNLNFDISSYFDTLYYEEGENVKKVYWTDNINPPRVINIITPSERDGGEFEPYLSNVFDFYPNAFSLDNVLIPEINVTKNRTVTSELPAGVVQYFVSYYWLNGAETAIVGASDTFTVDFSNRGAKADEVGMCAFDIEIPANTVNHSFDYMRVYSAVRTSLDGPLTVKIVGDIKLTNDWTRDTVYKITDTGIGQEQLDAGHLFFIGGSPFVAKTLTEKDDTLFVGGIKTKEVEISSDLEVEIANACRTEFKNGEDGIPDPENENNIKWWTKNGIIDFKLNKSIPNTPAQFNSFYPYKLQLDKGSSTYKTFKSGEIYRFGIQFQTNQGEWSTVVWIGDKECTERPVYDESTQCFKVNNAEFHMPNEIIEHVKAAGFVNYRLVIADPEKHNGRKIKMQGLLNPTMFTPGQRALDAPYALPSWIMRPRKGTAAYHHFEPLFSTEVSGAELASYTPDEIEEITREFQYPSVAYVEGYQAAWSDKGLDPPEYQHTSNPKNEDTEPQEYADWNGGYETGWNDSSQKTFSDTYDVSAKINKTKYTKPYIEEDDHDGKPAYVVTCFTVSPGNQLAIRSVKVWSDNIQSNFYDTEGHQPSKNDYKVLCDYTGSIGGVVYNNYGTITDFVPTQNQIDIMVEQTPTHDVIYHNSFMWSDKSTWPYVFWDGKEWTYDPSSDDPDYPDNWIPETICSPIYYGITEAFTKEGIDLRLIPEAELFSSIAQSLVNSAVSAVFLEIAKAIIAVATFLIMVTLSVVTLGGGLAAAVPGAIVLFAALGAALGASTAATVGLDVAANTESSNNKSLYSTDTIISQKNLRTLLGNDSLGNSNYDKLPEYQRTLMSKRYFPLYSTVGNASSYNRSDVPWPATDGSWSDAFDKIVFSKEKSTYYTTVEDFNNQTNGLVTIPDIFRPHAGRRTSSGGDLWLESATYIQVFPISVGNTINKEITNEYDNYYIDESYVTLNSPDAEDFSSGSETLKLRAVGTAPLTSNYTDAALKVNKSAATVEKGLNYDILYNKHRTTDVARDGYLALNSDYLYLDAGWFEETEDKWKLKVEYPAAYKTYLFSPNNYLGVISEDELKSEDDSETASLGTSGDFPGTNVKQQILNHNFSIASRYFATPCPYGDVHFGMAYDDNALGINTGSDLITYYPKYESAILKGDMSHHYMYLEDLPNEDSAPIGNKKAQGSVSLMFNSSPHVFIDLKNPENRAIRNLLPFFKNDTEDNYRASYDLKRYVWEDSIEDDVQITGHQTGSTTPIPDDKVEEVKSYLGISDNKYHTQKGLWKQNSGEPKSSYSIWDKGVVYHCGKYFIKDDYNEDVGDLVIYGPNDPDHLLSSFEQHVLNSVESYTTDPVFCSLLLAGLVKGYPNEGTSRGVQDYQIDLKADYARDIPQIIVGSWGEPTPLHFYASKLRLISLTISANHTDDGWVLVPSESEPGAVKKIVHTISLEYPTRAKDIVPNNDIYLNKLDETQPRFTFSLEIWHRYRTEDLENMGYRDYSDGEPYYPAEQYKDFRIRYEAPEIKEAAPTTPYLFIGELYQDIDHDILYGGYNPHALRVLSWYPISKATPIEAGSKIEETEGDTYYQRWDCLKTYPATEEDINQVVDITSFMVETHKNLDARCDVNRATFSLMARPTNFNLFNLVYNQLNNVFEYATDWSDLNSSNIPNEIAWSLTKNLYGDVDTWTNITLESSTRTKYPVTKLLNWNNQVIALTEHAMEIVNFNAKNLVPSADNTFIELQNSNKVDGTIRLQHPYGSHNMSTLITEQGLYFIEDNEKTLIRINGEGPKKIGISKLIDWFHNNIVQGTHTFSTGKPFHLEYDNVHKDIYIKNEDTCLVYNELLDEFTSILTYSGDYWLLNYGGNIYAYRLAYEPSNNIPFIGMYKMFGDTSYNKDFGRYRKNPLTEQDMFEPGSEMEYSVSYVINPNSYSDKVFTNGILAADLGVTGTDDNPMYPNSTKYTAKNKEDFPFNKIKVWNEYQDTGEVDFEKTLDRPSNLKQKFRIWRFIIPRDSKNNVWPRNRIRNPWARIKLFGNSTKKMEFHNMTIQYVE